MARFRLEPEMRATPLRLTPTTAPVPAEQQAMVPLVAVAGREQLLGVRVVLVE